jgi:hypothetical protein
VFFTYMPIIADERLYNDEATPRLGRQPRQNALQLSITEPRHHDTRLSRRPGYTVLQVGDAEMLSVGVAEERRPKYFVTDIDDR